VTTTCLLKLEVRAVADNRDSYRDEELESPIHTILGVAAILCIIGFVGFASSRRGTSGEAGNKAAQATGQATVEAPVAVAARNVVSEPPVVPVPDDPAPNPNIVVPNEPAPNVPVQMGEQIPPNPVNPLVKNDPVADPPRPVQPMNVPVSVTVPTDLINEPGIQIQLPFGRDAVQRCEKGCSSQAMCETNCRRLMSGEFARRILPGELDPVQLARDSRASCQRFSFMGGNPLSSEDKSKLRALLEPPQYFERSSLIERSITAGPFFSRLLPAEQPTPLSETVCLLEATLATELAIADAATARDTFSEMFYRRMEGQYLAMLSGLKPTIAPQINE